MRKFLLILLVLGLKGCSRETSNSIIEKTDQNERIERSLPQGEPINVLFIGNSHTYYNNGIGSHLSKMMVEGEPGSNYFISELTASGATLEDHLKNEITAQRLQERDWDIIVLQENSFIAYTQPDVVAPSALALKTEINDLKTEIFIFMTWAYKDNPGMYPVIRDACENAATWVSGTVVPVGVAFEKIRLNPSISIDLHDPDQFHPSEAGTFLASALFYVLFTGKDPSLLSYKANMEEGEALILKEIAKEVSEEYAD